MISHGQSTLSHVQSWSVTSSHGHSRPVMVTHVQSWSVMVSHGQSWSVMVSHGQLTHSQSSQPPVSAVTINVIRARPRGPHAGRCRVYYELRFSPSKSRTQLPDFGPGTFKKSMRILKKKLHPIIAFTPSHDTSRHAGHRHFKRLDSHLHSYAAKNRLRDAVARFSA